MLENKEHLNETKEKNSDENIHLSLNLLPPYGD
jgi:hypothetical protein